MTLAMVPVDQRYHHSFITTAIAARDPGFGIDLHHMLKGSAVFAAYDILKPDVADVPQRRSRS
jgi:hypothetical protein